MPASYKRLTMVTHSGMPDGEGLAAIAGTIAIVDKPYPLLS